MSKEFWTELEPLRELLQPIDEALKMSESGKSHLGHVLERWLKITKHLNIKKLDFQELEPFMSTDNGTFSKRYNRQVVTLHIVAFFLMPQSHNQRIPVEFDGRIYDFFRQYTTVQEEFNTLCCEFEDFRAQQPPFEPARRYWAFSNDPKRFWHAAAGNTEQVGKLAIRIFCTPVNSVASERAFSIQNLIHTKARNALQSERVEKLTYTYTNGRILHHTDKSLELESLKSGNSLDSLSCKEEVELEDILLVTEEDDELITTGIDSNGDKEDDDGDDDEVEDEDDE